jgi:hypothetical protein
MSISVTEIASLTVMIVSGVQAFDSRISFVQMNVNDQITMARTTAMYPRSTLFLFTEVDDTENFWFIQKKSALTKTPVGIPAEYSSHFNVSKEFCIFSFALSTRGELKLPSLSQTSPVEINDEGTYLSLRNQGFQRTMCLDCC